MADENMDPCECIWGHELAMRRLLNVIRNTQSTCTDSECIEENFSSQGPDSNMLLMTLFFVAALFLYYFRPRPQRISDEPGKPNNGSSGSPPNPPSALF